MKDRAAAGAMHPWVCTRICTITQDGGPVEVRPAVLRVVAVEVERVYAVTKSDHAAISSRRFSK